MSDKTTEPVSERARFDAWWSGVNLHYYRKMARHPEAELAWHAWQAAAPSPQTTPTEGEIKGLVIDLVRAECALCTELPPGTRKYYEDESDKADRAVEAAVGRLVARIQELEKR